ncbi:hypothetical protein C884_01720 [Kocuria palustris PEL]|uniref:Uncharacterized protein n=1 Tax=Kocuria palustris PEL TaxID=1236550 RepID=M2YA50_9MICC|nr:hypothetical protein C884_01720 [Kocuria palustris PEL]
MLAHGCSLSVLCVARGPTRSGAPRRRCTRCTAAGPRPVPCPPH